MKLQRDHRLRVEMEHMERLRSQSPFINYETISKMPGLLPDRYKVSFSCKGLKREDDVLVITEDHKVMIYLHAEYPTQQPRMAWLTPICHPNIKGTSICLGRSWTPAMTLDELCLVLGEMVQYKLFNLDDPLDQEASIIIRQMLQEKPNAVPVDNRNLLSPELDPRSSSMSEEVLAEQVLID